MEVYLDNSATTKPIDEVFDAIKYTLTTAYGNPSSLHKKGFEAEKLIDSAAFEIAKSLSCEKEEIFFTSGATESNNLALIGAAYAKKRNGKKIITTAIEHPSVLNCVKHLETLGFNIEYIYPKKDGSYSVSDFADAVDDDTILVSTMLVNNEVGLLLPVFDIAKAVKRKNKDALVHVDAVQGYLKFPIKLKGSSIDLMSISAHKVGGPKGIGALYIKKGVRIVPQLHGGGQQKGIRSGTENVPLIYSFGECVKAQSGKILDNKKHYIELKNYLLEKLSVINDVAVHDFDSSAPYIISIAIKGIRSEIMLHFLEQYDIYVSSGSACSKGAKSHVLKALSIKDDEADETLRISFCPSTTKQMIDIFVEKLSEGINTLAKKR